VISFQDVLKAAVKDFTEHGYDNPERLGTWIRKLREAITVGQPRKNDAVVRRSLATVYKRLMQGGIRKYHPGVAQFRINAIEPMLRQELNRRILASADLIVLNRDQAIEKTLQRFSGWATSVPTGGSRVVDKRDVKDEITKAFRSQDYEGRRLAIDQGHKLIANVSAIVAEQTGAIAAKWRHVHQSGYDGRPDHEARDGKVYAIRGNWAIKDGLMNKGAGYTDEITEPAFEPYCRCWYEYCISLTELPDSMLTQKGRQAP
jgi:hypothetical protein